MRQLRPGNKQTIRDINRALILSLVRRHRQLSRVQLARLSALSQATVSEIIGELLSQGMLVETDVVVSDRRGPRPTLLAIHPQGGFAVGVMIRPDGMNLVITDLLADVVARAYHPFPEHAAPDGVLQHAAHAIWDEIRRAGISLANILGVGVGITGEIDSETGVCRDAYILGWRNVPVGATLQRALGLPVIVDNDTRTLIIAERYVGLGREHETFVLVTVGRGVGMGAFVHGELLRGAQDVGVEFGHVTMQLDGPLCPCGKRGCLEAIVSDVGLVAAAQAAGLADAGTTIEALTARAQAGEAAVEALFTQAGTALGVGVANVITLFGPSLVVLTGEGLCAGELLLGPLRAALDRCVFGDRMRRLALVVRPWDPGWEPWARGAACLVLEGMVRPPLYHSVAQERATPAVISFNA
jgi:predicted NBD/HSP70 family sugar kinase